MRTLVTLVVSLGLLAPRAGFAQLKHLPADDTQHRQQAVTNAFHSCPAGGQASQPHPGGGVFDPDLNTLKNRTDEPSEYIDVTPAAIFELASPTFLKGQLRATWPEDYPDEAGIIASFEGLPLRVEGYLVVDKRYSPIQYGAQEEGPESTNCGAAKHEGDVHVWVAARKNKTMRRAFVVELTPRVRESLGQLSSQDAARKLKEAAKRSLKVRVSGWLFFDEDHPEQLMDREAGGKTYLQRRATLWEIHPVMKFEVEDGGWHDLTSWEP